MARTGEIGLLKLFSTTHFRGGSRIEMACGGRALAVLNALCAQNRDISVRLSAKPVQTAAAVARLASERTEAQQRAAALEDRLFALLAQSFILAAGVHFGADRRSLRKMNLMPRPPLLGEVASSEAMMTERFNRQWVRDYPKTKLNYIRSPFGIEGYRRGFLLHLVNP